MKVTMLMRVRSATGGVETTKSPSSSTPSYEAGSTEEGLEGRSNETLALGLTSVVCAGPTTLTGEACTDPETNISNFLNTGNSPWALGKGVREPEGT